MRSREGKEKSSRFIRSHILFNHIRIVAYKEGSDGLNGDETYVMELYASVERC